VNAGSTVCRAHPYAVGASEKGAWPSSRGRSHCPSWSQPGSGVTRRSPNRSWKRSGCRGSGEGGLEAPGPGGGRQGVRLS